MHNLDTLYATTDPKLTSSKGLNLKSETTLYPIDHIPVDNTRMIMRVEIFLAMFVFPFYLQLMD